MKKISILILFFLLANQIFAYAPFTTKQILVGEYKGEISKDFPYELSFEGKSQFIDLENIIRPFSNMKMGKYYYFDTGRVNMSNYNSGDFIIFIGDYRNGDFDDYFEVLELGKLMCNENNEIFIEEREGKIKAFGKELWGNFSPIPDWILSEEEILKSLKEEFEICQKQKNTEKMKIEEDIIDIVPVIEKETLPWYKNIISKIIQFLKNIF